MNSLKNCPGVDYQPGDVTLIDLTNSAEGTEIFDSFLASCQDQIDPVLGVTFGNPISPYVSPWVQIEIWNILRSFQNLHAADFIPGAPPFPYILGPIPPMGIQFHHSVMAIQFAEREIMNPQYFIPLLPHLLDVPAGNIICNLNYYFANAGVSKTIRKAE